MIVVPKALVLLAHLVPNQDVHARFDAVADLAGEGANGVDRQETGGLIVPSAREVQIGVSPIGAVVGVAVAGEGQDADLRLRGGGKGRGDGGADEGGEAQQERQEQRHAAFENVRFHEWNPPF